jgi:hypothetical protein
LLLESLTALGTTPNEETHATKRSAVEVSAEPVVTGPACPALPAVTLPRKANCEAITHLAND